MDTKQTVTAFFIAIAISVSLQQNISTLHGGRRHCRIDGDHDGGKHHRQRGHRAHRRIDGDHNRLARAIARRICQQCSCRKTSKRTRRAIIQALKAGNASALCNAICGMTGGCSLSTKGCCDSIIDAYQRGDRATAFQSLAQCGC